MPVAAALRRRLLYFSLGQKFQRGFCATSFRILAAVRGWLYVIHDLTRSE